MTRELQRAWLGTAISFFLNAVAWASVIVRMPEIKDALGASNSVLGLLLLVSVGGALSALRPAGIWCAKYGSSPVIVAGAIGHALFLPIAAWIPNAAVFVLGVFGALFFTATMDMAQNAHAVAIEHASGKKVMGRLHGLWSVGGIAGGVIGGVSAGLGISLLQQAFAMSALVIVAILLARPLYLPGSADRHEVEHKEKSKRRTRYPIAFWILALVGLAAALGEGAASDWGAVLLHDEWNASPFIASLPYIAFQTTMVIGRFSSDALSMRFGRVRILQICGLVTAIGLTTGLLIGDVVGVLLGWLSLGLGVSVVVPMVFSAAGALALNRYSDTIVPAQAVAVISGVVYSAFLFGPPMMGFLADFVSLRWAMLLIAALGLGIYFGSGVAKDVD